MSILELGPLTGVTSTSMIQADLGNNQNLVVISGIAVPNWIINDDGHLYFLTVQVHLGVYALNLIQSSVVVALCSIENDGSSFTFALDSASVALSPDTGELILAADTALSGKQTALSRFSYQIVATVEPVIAKVTGQIAWPASMWEPPSLDPAVIAPQLTILANQFVPGGAGSFGSNVAAAKGRVTSVERLRLPTAAGKRGPFTETYLASYEIDNMPLYEPLGVTVTPSSVFSAPGYSVGVAQVVGPLQFTLTTSNPSVVCDFSLAAFPPIR